MLSGYRASPTTTIRVAQDATPGFLRSEVISGAPQERSKPKYGKCDLRDRHGDKRIDEGDHRDHDCGSAQPCHGGCPSAAEPDVRMNPHPGNSTRSGETAG